MSLRDNVLLRGVKSLISRYLVTRKSFGFIHETSKVAPPVTLSGGGNIYK